MKKLLFVFLFSASFAKAQTVNWSLTDVKLGNNPDIETLNGMILKYVNDYRKINGLDKMQYDDSAFPVINKQVIFCYERLKLNHDRGYIDKNELIVDFKDHVNKYLGSSYIHANENLGSVAHPNIEEYTYDEIAYFIFKGWKNSPSHNAAMLVSGHEKASVSTIIIVNEGDSVDRIYSGIVMWH
jgi:hypothetical protein